MLFLFIFNLLKRFAEEIEFYLIPVSLNLQIEMRICIKFHSLIMCIYSRTLARNASCKNKVFMEIGTHKYDIT